MLCIPPMLESYYNEHCQPQLTQQIEIQKSEYIEIQNYQDLKFRIIAADTACPTNRL